MSAASQFPAHFFVVGLDAAIFRNDAATADKSDFQRFVAGDGRFLNLLCINGAQPSQVCAGRVAFANALLGCRTHLLAHFWLFMEKGDGVAKRSNVARTKEQTSLPFFNEFATGSEIGGDDGTRMCVRFDDAFSKRLEGVRRKDGEAGTRNRFSKRIAPEMAEEVDVGELKLLRHALKHGALGSIACDVDWDVG